MDIVVQGTGHGYSGAFTDGAGNIEMGCDVG